MKVFHRIYFGLLQQLPFFLFSSSFRLRNACTAADSTPLTFGTFLGGPTAKLYLFCKEQISMSEMLRCTIFLKLRSLVTVACFTLSVEMLQNTKHWISNEADGALSFKKKKQGARCQVGKPRETSKMHQTEKGCNSCISDGVELFQFSLSLWPSRKQKQSTAQTARVCSVRRSTRPFSFSMDAHFSFRLSYSVKISQ